MKKTVLALLLVFVVSSLAFAAHVDPMLKEFKGTDKIPVIVMMQPGAKHADVKALGGEKFAEWNIINGFAANLPAAAVNALAKNPNVLSISYDREVQADLNNAVKAVRADLLWPYGYNGTNVKIAVVDTGIYPHQDLAGRIIAFKDYVNGYTSPYDDHGHGTHCAGIVGGAGSTYRGPSYDADFIGVKVLAANGSGSTSNIINGVNYAVNAGADVISMSLGGTPYTNSSNDPLCQAVKSAWNSGVTVVVAAGNEGPNYYTIGTPGIEPAVITVGATDDKGTSSTSDDVVVYFSSRGPTSYDGWEKPDVLAPGTNITSLDNAYSGYVTMSGTSMATPLVAGVVGQIMEAHPTWSNNYIKSKLMSTAVDMGYDKWTQGAGLIDAYAAVFY